MIRRIAALVTKEFIQLGRDLLFVIVILLGPASELTAVAYATSAEIQHLPLAICDHDRSLQSRALVQALVNTETFDIVEYVSSPDVLTEMLDRNEIYTAVIIPPHYGADLDSSTVRPQVQVLLNGAESTAAETALGSIEGALAQYSIDLIPDFGELSDIAQLEPSARVWYNEELREANYTIPSELGFMLYMVALWVAALGFARERELGTLEQLMVTPLSRFEMIIGKSIPAVVIAYINFLLMLAMTVFLFKVPMRGSLILLLGLALFYILVELQRGLLVSVLSRTQQQGLLIVFTMAFVDMTFAGYAVPVESMPQVLQTISYIFPIRHWLIIMRGIMLKGVGFEVFWPHVLAIAGLGVMLTATTLLAFRYALGRE